MGDLIIGSLIGYGIAHIPQARLQAIWAMLKSFVTES